MSIVPNSFERNGFIGLLLTGGLGTRFRASAREAQVDKLTATLSDGRAVVAGAVASLQQVVPVVVAVVRPDSDTLRQVLQGLGCVVIETPDARRGMGASLAAGACFLLRSPQIDMPRGCLVALGDMPWIAPATMARVCTAAETYRIAAPSYEGKRGHPVAFAWDLLPELASLDGDSGARSLLALHGVHEVACGDPGVLRDVDTVADLAGPARD
jgi:molybdenum cofactor cytidylyltransferase